MNITPKTKKIINLISDIVISVMLFLTGILFSVSCYSIYTSAESQMFTYEKIGEAFGRIAAAVYITLVLVAIGAVLKIVLPVEGQRLRAPGRTRKVCLALGERVDITKLGDTEKSRIERERKFRKILLIANIVIVALELFLPLIYLLNPATFPAERGEYNNEVLRGFLTYLCMLLPLVFYEIAYFILTRRSYASESEMLKAALAAGAGRAKSSSEGKGDDGESSKEAESEDAPKGSLFRLKEFFTRNEKRITLGIRISVCGFAVLFIVLGILNGGMTDVLVKAVNICAECIGLG